MYILYTHYNQLDDVFYAAVTSPKGTPDVIDAENSVVLVPVTKQA